MIDIYYMIILTFIRNNIKLNTSNSVVLFRCHLYFSNFFNNSSFFFKISYIFPQPYLVDELCVFFK